MADARAVLRVISELLWSLRRSGFRIATSQAIDAVRAVRAVGLSAREDVREALAAVVVTRARERPRFDAVFDRFFARDPRRTLWERLAAQGFDAGELESLRALLDAMASSSPDGSLGVLVHRGAELDRLFYLTGVARTLDAMQTSLQAGFYTHRLLERIGTHRAQGELAALHVRLVDALGHERADALTKALAGELRIASDEARAFVSDTATARERERQATNELALTPFAALDPEEVEEVRRAVRSFVQRLRGGERVRRRRATRGRIDAHRTLRRAFATGGVPFVVARRARRRDKPRLILLCDVSDSVRDVARFLLEFTYAAQELFDRTRTFVFVSEIGETTRLFAAEGIEAALARAYSGAVVPITHNSNYGRVLRAFEERHLRDVDRRTTVVILGDGRTNYHEPAVEVLDAIRARARSVLWLCPEPRGAWAIGDSAMPRYAPKCTAVLEVRCARDLEEAARAILAAR